MSTVRFYKCGCVPDCEEFCKEAEEMVWKERDAVMVRPLGYLASDARENSAFREGYGRGWMNCHIGGQDARGEYKDVPEADLEPPEDDYDENPRAWGGR